jgi:hypothetical protein
MHRSFPYPSVTYQGMTFARSLSARAREGGAEVSMTTTTNKGRAWCASFAVALLAIACGGRTTDNTNGTDVPGSGTTPTDTTVPTCAEICRHVVDTCFPGAKTDPCVKDCEDMRTDFAGCKALDAFLRCNLTARVVCTEKATIDDCYEERNNVVRCKS